MNLDLLKLTHHPPTDDYVNNLFTSGFLQLITKPTRCKNNSATLIDHFITNVMKNAYTCGVIISDISDHFPIFLFLEEARVTVANPILFKRKFTKYASLTV